MAQKDLTEKSLEFYPDVFADVVNALIYQGKQTVAAENLLPAPTETLYSSNHGRLRNQFHDVSKYEMDRGKIRIQYTLENESKVKRRTVLRKAGYEGAVYRERYEGGEVFPFVSILLFWGKGRWKAPASLHQLFDCGAEQKEYIDNIRLNVYEMAHLSEKVRERFHSDMRIIVDYLAEGKNYVPSGQKIQHLEEVLRMLKALTGDDRYEEIFPDLQEEKERTGGISMCELLDKYENRGREAGMVQGMKRMSELISHLISDGRSDEIARTVTDKEYQNQLLAEYGL